MKSSTVIVIYEQFARSCSGLSARGENLFSLDKLQDGADWRLNAMHLHSPPERKVFKYVFKLIGANFVCERKTFDMENVIVTHLTWANSITMDQFITTCAHFHSSRQTLRSMK